MADSSIGAQEERQLVIFDLACEAYGVDINAVQGIIRMQTITKVPRTPEYVEGVINLRGEVIPVVDLRKRFGLTATEETKDSRIVVVYIGEQQVGMVVDAVTEVLRISADSIEPPSSVITTADSAYLMGIAKLEERLIILLDLEQVFSDAEKHKVSAARRKAEEKQAEPVTATASVEASEVASEVEAAPVTASKKK
jgi:purine-binding chemotaxis protein CheW